MVWLRAHIVKWVLLTLVAVGPHLVKFRLFMFFILDVVHYSIIIEGARVVWSITIFKQFTILTRGQAFGPPLFPIWSIPLAHFERLDISLISFYYPIHEFNVFSVLRRELEPVNLIELRLEARWALNISIESLSKSWCRTPRKLFIRRWALIALLLDVGCTDYFAFWSGFFVVKSSVVFTLFYHKSVRIPCHRDLLRLSWFNQHSGEGAIRFAFFIVVGYTYLSRRISVKIFITRAALNRVLKLLFFPLSVLIEPCVHLDRAGFIRWLEVL